MKERKRELPALTCVVCKKKDVFPYARYNNEGEDDVVCSRTCDREYNKRDKYGH